MMGIYSINKLNISNNEVLAREGIDTLFILSPSGPLPL